MNRFTLDNLQNFLNSAGTTAGRLFSGMINRFFLPASVVPWSMRLVVLLLLVAGVLHWHAFFGPEKLSLDFEDWPKERCYLDVLREAIATRTVPLHMDANLQTTQRFFSIPETMLAPHVVLLGWMTNQQFIAFHSALMCVVGIFGCWALARRFDWNPFTLLFFGVVFSFNGFIVCRLAVGHFMWLGYYLFPWVLVASLRLMDEPENPRRWIELSATFFALFLIGSFHLAIWWMIFLGLCALTRPKLILPVAASLALSGIVGMFRIAPAAITFGGVHREFASGYPNLVVLWQAFVSPLTYDTPFVRTPTASLGWWEFDHFVGACALLPVIWFAFKPGENESENETTAYRLLLVAATVLGFLSLSRYYAPVANAPIPLFNAERVTTRFISVSFLVFLFCAAQRFSRASIRYSTFAKIVAGALLLQTGFELETHTALWRPALLEATHSPSSYWENAATMTAHVVHLEMEHKYKLVVAASWFVSSVAVIAAAFTWNRLGQTQRPRMASPASA